MEVKYKNLSEIEGLELFTDYAIDVDGNVWSFKNRKIKKLKPGWVRKQGGYLFVRLTDRYGMMRNFYIHRLVALAFLPIEKDSQEVTHKDGNYSNNKIENLEWRSKSKNRKLNVNHDIHLDTFLSEKIKKIHAVSVRKGLQVPDLQTFTNTLLEGSMENYINQYGLRRLLIQ